ncbi:hypothetical protein DID88_000900 [Monilinia fructigena]|uniref:2EXR domain-containing protein n=1 Tax=Monilinia fructigena TaxID=38457 RepID=A0A395IYJ5_9HELO|nr:hypothetical protein DID88_000900 [Monilinia fructigena]
MAPPKSLSQIIAEDNQCVIVPAVNVNDPVEKQRFPKFGELPKELQINIWKWYGRINAKTPNVIKVRQGRQKERAEGPLQRGIMSREHLTHINESQKAVYAIPPIFLVCTTSRVAGEELYRDEFQIIPMGDNDRHLAYYNEDKDIIYLMNLFTFQDWRYNRQTDSEREIRTRTNFAAPEPITRRINMKHLVIGGRLQNPFMWKLLGRFYDCETIMVEAFDNTESTDFASFDFVEDVRDFYIRVRDALMGYWENERYGPFVRPDYRGKPIRPVIAKPSWDPAERTISNPILLFRLCNMRNMGHARAYLSREHPAIRQKPHKGKIGSRITFYNDYEYSPTHAWQYEHPWRTYIG